MATSYNGWPATQSGDGIDRNFIAAGQKFPGGVRAGAVATIFRWLIEKLNTVEPIVAGWNWGYEYRANVNNPSTLSCHSSGTAIDYNAPNHPNGARGTWSSAQVSAIRGFLAQLDGVVRWGYDFTGTKDEMHFEIIGSDADVNRVAASLGDPGKPGNPVEEDMPLTDADVAKIAAAIVPAVASAVWNNIIERANEPAWSVLLSGRNSADVAKGLLDSRPAVLGRQSVIEALAQTRNDASATKLKVVDGGIVTPPAGPPTYTVAAGDTLGAIAKKFGVTVDDLVAWNGITDPNNIAVGQVLTVGKG